MPGLAPPPAGDSVWREGTMSEVELYWLKVSALSQVAAAVATFLAFLCRCMSPSTHASRGSG